MSAKLFLARKKILYLKNTMDSPLKLLEGAAEGGIGDWGEVVTR